MDNHKALREAAARTTSRVEVDRLDLAELLQELDCALLAGGQKPAKSQYPADFEEAWSQYPKRPGNSKADAFKQWKARIKGGATPEEMINGVIAYAKYCRIERTEPNYVKQAATFFGPGKHYEADWSPARRAEDRGLPPLHMRGSAPDLDAQRQRASDEAKAKLTGRRAPPPDDGMTIDMVP